MQAATAVIDCHALRHNLQRIRQLAPGSRVMAIIKANAYGHGLSAIAKALPDVDGFGVARLEEALQLRANGIKQPILLLEGTSAAADLPVLAAHNLQTVIHCTEQLAILENTRLAHPIDAWVKLDSGMHRLGVRPEEADAFYQRVSGCQNLRHPVSLMTHFACADQPASALTAQQIRCFDRFAEHKPGEQSLAASGAILCFPESHRDWVRPGILLYGVSPRTQHTAAAEGFIPVMTLKSTLIAIRTHKAGETVGYGATWSSPHDTLLGVVAIGYGDGYPRHAPSGTPVWLNGREVPLVGRVSMDMGKNAQDKVGDEVILWGKELPVEKIADHAATIGYTLVTGLTSRVTMQYLFCSKTHVD
jgi:alanine racemase